MKYTNYLRNIRGFSEKTILVYEKYVKELVENNYDYREAIKKYSHCSNTTKRLILSSYKSFYKFNKDQRYEEITLPKRNVVVKEYISFNQYKGYLEKVNRKTKLGLQKYIIIRLLFETGIRSTELLKIRKSDITSNKIFIRGKGNKERYVWISEWLFSDLKEYTKSFKGEFLFNFKYKNLYQRIKNLDKERSIAPHMFRRGFAKHCNNNGVSIYDISLAMGHNSIDTTASYIKRESSDVSLSHVFYKSN